MGVVPPIQLQPLGIVHNAICSPQDDCWGGLVSTIELDPILFTQQSLNGIEQFSHLEIIYFMHKVSEATIPCDERHPRNLAHLPKVGILAQRPKARPNRLGLSRCRLLDRSGLVLTVQDLDAIDGSPVLDIKPYFEEFGPRGEIHQAEWTREVLRDYFRDGRTISPA